MPNSSKNHEKSRFQPAHVPNVPMTRNPSDQKAHYRKPDLLDSGSPSHAGARRQRSAAAPAPKDFWPGALQFLALLVQQHECDERHQWTPGLVSRFAEGRMVMPRPRSQPNIEVLLPSPKLALPMMWNNAAQRTAMTANAPLWGGLFRELFAVRSRVQSQKEAES
jgi:hypothetical protein